MGITSEDGIAKSYHLHVRATDSGFTLGRAGGGTPLTSGEDDMRGSIRAACLKSHLRPIGQMITSKRPWIENGNHPKEDNQ